ncbi:50S ribosomal protein L4 [Rubidibacter lacunae KORDI 51-2]|uniref:Large ribosomal subunit protein uL4 n=1 Tax=Rubidibacter lacunae KORDI 51-2 TaxID=582515 RepID=U5DKL0_9CHRO|nr:50S ribosomal protein L4 [Rubidibacter lacunae]ERN42216.1 50S ribosomal protein L4 [Rubidibacter lacunae KORDI 51-2]
MTSCTVKNWEGEAVGEATIELRVAREENVKHLLHRAVVRQQTNARQGNASTKTRAEVRGGGRKPWRQKGTGRARAGSIRSPLWRGGGVIFGPRPRDFEVRMNRKERRLALRTAVMNRMETAIVVENFAEQFPRPKTADMVAALGRWGVTDKDKVLLVLTDMSDNVFLSARNISNLKMLRADSLNVLDLMTYNRLVTTPAALKEIQEVYGA